MKRFYAFVLASLISSSISAQRVYNDNYIKQVVKIEGNIDIQLFPDSYSKTLFKWDKSNELEQVEYIQDGPAMRRHVLSDFIIADKMAYYAATYTFKHKTYLAQNEYVYDVDSIGTSIPLSLITRKLNSSGNIKEIVTKKWDGQNYNLYSKRFYHYDSFTNAVGEVTYHYIYGDSTISHSAGYFFTYDNKGNIISCQRATYDPNGWQPVNNHIKEYYTLNDDGSIKSIVRYLYIDQDSSWHKDDSLTVWWHEFEHGNDEFLHTVKNREQFLIGDYNFSVIGGYQFDSLDIYKFRDSIWLHSKKFRYEYNDAGLISSISFTTATNSNTEEFIYFPGGDLQERRNSWLAPRVQFYTNVYDADGDPITRSGPQQRVYHDQATYTLTYSYANEASIMNRTQSTYFSLYPNPASSTLTLSSANALGETQVSISDLTGKTVAEYSLANASNTESLNISGLKPGFYIVNVNNGEHVMSERLIVK